MASSGVNKGSARGVDSLNYPVSPKWIASGGAEAGEALIWDGDEWVPGEVSSGDGADSGVFVPTIQISIDETDYEVGDARIVEVVDGSGSYVRLALPTPSPEEAGRILIVRVIDTNLTGSVLAFYLSTVEEAPAILTENDGLFSGAPDASLDWSGVGESETQNYLVNGVEQSIVLNEDFAGNYNDYFAALISKFNAIGLGFETTLSGANLYTLTSGSSASVQLVSVVRGSVSSGFNASGTVEKSGFDAQTGVETSPGWAPGDNGQIGDPILEPDPNFPNQQSAILYMNETSWQPILRKYNILSNITMHLNGALEPGDYPDPLDGPGSQTFGRTNAEVPLVDANIMARFALGRTIEADDADVDQFISSIDERPDFSSSLNKIVLYESSNTKTDESTIMWFGTQSVWVHDCTQGRSLTLFGSVDGLSTKMGGTLIVTADSSVEANPFTINAPAFETVDNNASYVIEYPGSYVFTRGTNGWNLSSAPVSAMVNTVEFASAVNDLIANYMA